MSDPGPRRAGLLIPLFACASSQSWGIGDIGDLPTIARWLAKAGQRVLQLLPLNEMAPGQQSPYSAISAMAIDPIYISLSMVPEFVELGGEEALSDADRVLLAQVRRAPRVDYTNVRALKQRACRSAFERFYATEWRNDTTRARAFRLFLSEQAWWIEDYAIFRAVHVREGERPWPQWPEALQRREPTAIDHARRELSREVLFHQYLQWLAGVQWQQARSNLHGVQLFGDLPFMVDTDSADVWARQDQFRLDLSLGAPPDAFSATGQDWGMPVYRWRVIALQDFRWLRERARRSADLYNGYRIDHLVGFYRTYGRPRDGTRRFSRRRRSANRKRWGSACSVCSVRQAQRSLPRISAPSLISSAARWRARASRDFACCAGSGTGTRRDSRSAIPPTIPASRSLRLARTTPRRWSAGGKPPRTTSA